ncbi:hypothetical protein AVEN_33063-1 [Araneus ventricosus]|uniref:Uncharacterized protein n=1 Tax=Araneus ventricosus TaxID=182803 RepID=A0A4Y2EI79_ARAVE|nr:hypothetical protein AVEN_33063-1 [Araneus ventricosus]
MLLEPLQHNPSLVTWGVVLLEDSISSWEELLVPEPPMSPPKHNTANTSRAGPNKSGAWCKVDSRDLEIDFVKQNNLLHFFLFIAPHKLAY